MTNTIFRLNKKNGILAEARKPAIKKFPTKAAASTTAKNIDGGVPYAHDDKGKTVYVVKTSGHTYLRVDGSDQ